MLFHHILSALYAIIFSSAMFLYTGVLASPLPLPLALVTPGYGTLASTKNTSTIRKGDASPTAAPHQLDFFTNKGHSLHHRGENYFYELLKTYKSATTVGPKFCELRQLTFLSSNRYLYSISGATE
ncbi:hypothetical protein AX14_006933 [Amanita brunnescens Koide BX004]|nr:hypothetical protein AX14_006933 [Amanita brunnescens Koide BX004]